MNICKCGCGKECKKTYISGHNITFAIRSANGKKNKGIQRSEEFKDSVSKFHKGRKRSLKTCENISSGRKGIVFSQEHKDNLIKAHIGIKYNLSDECRKRKAENMRKIAYIDGRTPLINAIRSLAIYTEWRNKIFKRDNYICRICGKSSNSDLNAHHKNKFREIFKEFLHENSKFSPNEDKETLLKLAIEYKPFWDIDNGITFCQSCHTKYEKYGIGEIIHVKSILRTL